MGSVGNRQNTQATPDSGAFRTDRTLYSKSQVDELTADYTPQMFLGDINNEYTGSLNSLRYHAEDNAPDTLNIGGYTFQQLGNPHTDFDGKNKNIIVLDYQSTEQVGNEYPVLQVGIRVWRTRGGKVKSEIIRDGDFINRTRFW